VDIFSGDPAFPGEVFKRTVDFKKVSCGDSWFTLELGESGPFTPGLNVIRYAFTVDVDVKPVSKEGKILLFALEGNNVNVGRKMGSLLDRAFKSVLAQEIIVEGSDVFPLSTRILRH
jgi:hypothetical protein